MKLGDQVRMVYGDGAGIVGRITKLDNDCAVVAAHGRTYGTGLAQLELVKPSDDLRIIDYLAQVPRTGWVVELPDESAPSSKHKVWCNGVLMRSFSRVQNALGYVREMRRLKSDRRGPPKELKFEAHLAGRRSVGGCMTQLGFVNSQAYHVGVTLPMKDFNDLGWASQCNKEFTITIERKDDKWQSQS